MIEIHENRERLLDDLVRAPAFHLADESDAAGVVLELRIVQSLLFGWAVGGHGFGCIGNLPVW